MNDTAKSLDADDFQGRAELQPCQGSINLDDDMFHGLIVSSSKISPGEVTLRIIKSGGGVIDIFMAPENAQAMLFRLNRCINEAQVRNG